ncbi:hypothetical protein MMC31_002764 [Peltigera leucophlebia]|nr:hypothetical protein [Peltigera leucophlebia]
MFWRPFGGLKGRLQQLIFGSPETTTPHSKTRINALYNMLTLSPDAHNLWADGKFTLEPLGAEANLYQLRAAFRWTPPRSEDPKELGIATDPGTIELIPLDEGELIFDHHTRSELTDGHIVTITTHDPVIAPLPSRDLLMLQYFLIRVLRMAGRAGADMLETFDSDDEVSSIAAINAGSLEEEPLHELAHSEKPPLAKFPQLGINIASPPGR